MLKDAPAQPGQPAQQGQLSKQGQLGQIDDSPVTPEVLLEGVRVVHWGLVEYDVALARQLELVERVHQGLDPETVVLCSHPPVVTLGRATRPGDVSSWPGSIVEVNRGGRATYHGPSQIVVYPILNLELRGRDLHSHMRSMENATVRALAEWGVTASGRSLQTAEGDAEPVEATGVWIGSRKVASIGIGVRRWISFHGLALNVERDPRAFIGMKPCGFTSETMISLEEAVGAPIDRPQLEEHLTRCLLMELAQPERS